MGTSACKRILNFAAYHCGIAPFDAPLWKNMTRGHIGICCESLLKYGYFNRYDLKDSGSFYTLTEKGRQIFLSSKAVNYIDGEKHKESDFGETITDAAGPALARIMIYRTVDYMYTLCSAADWNGSYTTTNFDSANIAFLNVFKKDLTIRFSAVVSSDPLQFLLMCDLSEKISDQYDVLAVIGTDLRHAEAISGWIRSNIPEDKHLWYVDHSTGRIYNQADNTEITPENVKGLLGIEGTPKPPKDDPEPPKNDPKPPKDDPGPPKNDPKPPKDDPEPPKNDPEPHPEPPAIISAPPPKNLIPPFTTTDITLTDELQKHFSATLSALLSAGKFACAAAYARALAERCTDHYYPFAVQLSYALNDPLEECSYTSENILRIYVEEDENIDEGFFLSAALRCCFLDPVGYDYMLSQLYSIVSAQPSLQNNNALGQVFYLLYKFKSEFRYGMEHYADYRQQENAAGGCLETVLEEAASVYELHASGIIQEKVASKRGMETRRLLFAKDSDLMTCLEAVKNNERDFLPVIEDFLHSTCIRDGAEITAENISVPKLEAIINAAWLQAGRNTGSSKNRMNDITGKLQSTFLSLYQKAASILCEYISLCQTTVSGENSEAIIEYRRSRAVILDNMDAALTGLSDAPGIDTAGMSLLRFTLEEIRSRLDGSYTPDAHRYFYFDFLKNDRILLDENLFPILLDIPGIDELSILTRLETHASLPEHTPEERLREILLGGDDFGSARQILAYLKTHPDEVSDPSLLSTDLAKAAEYPRGDIENKRKGFLADLELAHSYGQIDNTDDKKERFVQLMETWYARTLKTENYGFFYKILEAIRKQIKKDSVDRSHDLINSLNAWKTANPDRLTEEDVTAAIQKIQSRIDSQHYTAAEDLLNHLSDGDLQTDFDFIRKDYLAEFLEEYNLNSNMAGSSGSSLYTRAVRFRNKDGRGASRLIDNWPLSNGTHPDKIRALMTALDFNVESVTAGDPIRGKSQYLVTLARPKNGRKINYKHPIYAFGYDAEDSGQGFRVVTILGKMDAGRLLDTFREIGSDKNTIVLLDHTLSLPDRRELARLTKLNFHARPFLVIDRVVIMYLANHYQDTSVNRMLMAVTVPFAAYQPYIADSAQPMPPEMFTGRKNELEKIEQSGSGVSIVYGGRQLGKSALLRMAQNDIDRNENGDRALYVVIRELDYKGAAKKVSAKLYESGILKKKNITESWEELADDIRERLNDPEERIPYFLLLLDEADTFIESCMEIKYRPLEALKEIQNIGRGRFKFVIAGLRDIVRFERGRTLGDNSGLTHMQSLTVQPFTVSEARELLEVPLSYLGFRFPDDPHTEMLISTILGTTNYFPGLLQLYCTKLIEALQKDYAGYDENEAPPYIVKEEHIKKALSDKTLEGQIKEKFEITLRLGDDNYYYLIALIAAYHYHTEHSQNGCSPQDILEIASEWEVGKITELSVEKVSALMEEMRELNVFRLSGQGHYSFARYNFCHMMGSRQQLEDEILKYAELEDVT